MKFQGTMTDLAWLAGLLEGEGYFYLEGDRYARIRLKMTDRDVVWRAYAVSGVGTFYESHPPRDRATGRKRTFVWTVRKKQDVLDLLEALHPMMGARRASKIQEILKHNDMEGPVLA